MSSSNFLTNPRTVLVADASVVINLNATGRAHAIIAAFSNRWAVTANAFAELVNGIRNGHDDARALRILIDKGAIDIVGLGDSGSRIYETLIDGSALRTLDDGEAATIGYAHEVGGIALIDERKAIKLCADAYPELTLITTVQILLHPTVIEALGPSEHIDVIMAALNKARMRVPPDQIAKVVAVIGQTNAASCLSLPRTVRDQVVKR